MGTKQTVFNHVGLCVSNLERSRSFYENVFGFAYWWELQAPEEDTAALLQLDTPLELVAVYLVRDGFVLELLNYRPDRLEPWRKRSMAEPGLTHMSLSVDDLEAAMARVEHFGGSVIRETNNGPAVMVRDPDGQLIELLGMAWREHLPPTP